MHAIGAKIFFEDALYIVTPSKAHQCTVCMSPILPLSAVDSKKLYPLFSVERPVEVWTSFLARISSFHAIECASLSSYLDLTVDRDYYSTFLKNKQRPGFVQSIL